MTEALAATGKVVALLREFFEVELQAEDNLFTVVSLDSMQLLDLVSALEERFDCRIPIEEIRAENLATALRIGELVARSLRAGAANLEKVSP